MNGTKVCSSRRWWNWASRPGRTDKILRTARTIADLEEAPDVTATHLAEAVQYRRLDRNLFA